MQVYFVTQVGSSNNPDLFRNFGDIESSLRVSFSQALDLKIVKTPTKGPVQFIVTGAWPTSFGPDLGGKTFKEVFEAVRYPVWDSPTHL